jgi:hypothetical protein
MPILYYMIPMVAGPYGRTNPQRPQYVDEIACNWSGHNVNTLGVYVCMVNTTAAKHADLASRADVFQLPAQYTWDTVISDMQAAARNYVRNLCNNRLGIDYDATETIGECLMRIINSGLFELADTPVTAQFQSLSANQQAKIVALFQRLGLTIPSATETVKQISQRGGRVVWPGNDRSKVNVDEF